MSPLLLWLACGTPPPITATPVATAPVAEATTAGRSWRRMNIDQLKASIQKVTGGISWTEEDGNGETDLFEALDGTLGKPDYLSATEEDLAPGLLFQKFLDDAATSACSKLVSVDPGRSGEQRTLLVEAELADTPLSNPEAVEANIRAALLRFHGKMLAAGDPTVEPWKELVYGVYDDQHDMAPAWEALCVALIVHPDFYRY